MSDNHHRMSHRSRIGAALTDKAKDKENNVTNNNVKKSILNSENNSANLFDFSSSSSSSNRRILRTKSANGQKVLSSKSFNTNISNNTNKTSLHSSDSILNANKARKVVKQQPFTIFDGTTDTVENNNHTFHDSTTLHRSQSQLGKGFKSLSRSSSAFNSSFGSTLGSSLDFTTNRPEARKIKSQLTIGAENDMADFFKKSKIQEQQQLGISNDNANISESDNNLTEVTFADDHDDISSMKKLLTERDSPSYQRTHKVSLHNLLSSSSASDDLEETTFEYKQNENNKTVMDLESLMMSSKPAPKKDHTIDVDNEIEVVSHNINGRYNDNDLPDSLEGLYKPMNKEVLQNLWGKSNHLSLDAAEKFEDPLSLKPSWNTETENNKNVLDVDLGNMKEPEELVLEFSDANDESEDEGEKKGNENLIEIMHFYEKKGLGNQ